MVIYFLVNAPACARPSATRSEGHTLKYCSVCNRNSRTRQRTVAFESDSELEGEKAALIREPRFDYTKPWVRTPVIVLFAELLPEYYFCRVISTCVTCDLRRNTEVVDLYYRRFNRFRLIVFWFEHLLGRVHFFPKLRE